MNRIIILLSLLCVAIFSSIVSATIINIPADYATIQAGIDASTDGDTVLVQPGTYVENINFNGHNIVLGSLFLTTGDTNYIEQTVIDGDSAGTVIICIQSPELNQGILGFTIQNGFGTGAADGGGIRCFGSQMTISNNIIKNNVSYGGGGISCGGCSPRIIHNKIINNISLASGVSGGGILCDRSGALIENNIITDNIASNGSYWDPRVGGGLAIIRSYPTITVRGNIFTNNISDEGGGIECWGSGAIIEQNIICRNKAIRWGGAGILIRYDPIPTIINNTISDNSYNGIRTRYCDPIVLNIICYNNEGQNIEGNIQITYSNIQGGWEGEGNIDENPHFVDPGNYDYNICENSPCIDFGDPNNLDPDGTRSDMGFYYSEHPECLEDRSCWFVAITGNDTSGNGSSEFPFRTIQKAISQSYHSDTVLVERGIYTENINLDYKRIYLYSNFVYSNDSLDILETIIDGDSIGSTLSISNCDHSTSIRGLTFSQGRTSGICCINTYAFISDNIITNNFGSGIFCDSSSVTISNNLINANVADSGSGILCRNLTGADINNNNISNNTSTLGGGIYMTGSSVNIHENTISTNTAVHAGGLYIGYTSWRPEIVSNNSVIYNHSSENGGGIYIDCAPYLKLRSNDISMNSAQNGAGIYINSYSESIFTGNKIIENSANFRGGGIFMNNFTTNSSFGFSDNNILVRNFAGNNGAALAFANSITSMKNVIIWDNLTNGDDIISVDNLSNIGVYFSDIQDTLWPGEGNIDLDPLFRDPENGDFHLMAIECGDPFDSPCIDAGHPGIIDTILSCDWGLGTERSDMGAYSGGEGAIGIDEPLVSIPAKISLSQNYPNPFNASTIIKYELPQQSQVTIEIYDILGRKVSTLVDRQQPAGYHQAIWRADDFASGMYFYKLQAGDFNETKKMLLLK